MRRLGAIMLTLILLMDQTPLQQICCAPKLFKHFHEHRLKEPEMGFLKFLVAHYITDDGVPTDDQKDRELPFHSAKCNIHPDSFDWLATRQELHTFIQQTHFEEFTENKMVFLSVYTQDFWKPPKNQS
jgi:hypothetical protein